MICTKPTSDVQYTEYEYIWWYKWWWYDMKFSYDLWWLKMAAKIQSYVAKNMKLWNV